MSTLEITDPRDDVAKVIVSHWDNMNQDRRRFLNKGLEARKYVTATSTNDTEVGNIGWKNNTTIPKLAQIAENLQSYYMAALMPSDDWFIWEGSDRDSQRKADLIEAYMRTKLKMSGFRSDLERVVKDWIMYGNCFASVEWVEETTVDAITEEKIVNYIGPRIVRISPLDCVIDYKARSFSRSPFIHRQLVPIVDVLTHNDSNPDRPYKEEAVEKIRKLRGAIGTTDNTWLDYYKEIGYEIDGFNDFYDYLDSQYIELLTYYGDIYVTSTGEVRKNQIITVADRSFELMSMNNPAWSGNKPIAHSGWRILPDNLYAQGPLDNLVGMQYRCDHLENLKADAYDQIIHPIVKITGSTVEDFTFGPGARIDCGDEGDVDLLRPDTSVLTADNQIAFYHRMMEEMAGSPRESMGFRTPGEKTAFEVEVLTQGADRVFQDKLNHFEVFIQQILNLMFELMIRNFNLTDIAQVFNDDTKALEMQEITREDVVANGTLKPVGAKHFADRNKRVKELQNFLMLKGDPSIAPHVSGLEAAKMFEEELGWQKYNIVEENIAIREQAITQMEAAEAQRAIQQAMGEQPQPQEGQVEPQAPINQEAV